MKGNSEQNVFNASSKALANIFWENTNMPLEYIAIEK